MFFVPYDDHGQPFRFFETLPEIIRLALMLCIASHVRCNAEYVLHGAAWSFTPQRGREVCRSASSAMRIVARHMAKGSVAPRSATSVTVEAGGASGLSCFGSGL